MATHAAPPQFPLGRLLSHSAARFEMIGPARHRDQKQTSMKAAKTKKELSPKQREELLAGLKARFEKNIKRHAGLDWAKVKARLESNSEKLWSLSEMERTEGEPDVVGQDKKTGEFLFVDCAAQSPDARSSLCYDREALDGRKK